MIIHSGDNLFSDRGAENSSVHKVPVVIQIAGAALALVPILWGIAAVCTVAFPGASGEWAALAVYLAYLVYIPAGIITLLIGSFVKRGNGQLRRVCIIAAVITMLLPFVADVIHRF